MHLCEFVEDYNGAPYDLEEFAQLAAKVEDNQELSEAGQDYISAKQHFENMLSTYGVELG